LSQSITAFEAAPVLHPAEFEKISRLAYEHFGVDLRNGKQALVEARIGKKLRELGLKSFQHYYDYVTADKTGEALTAMVDILTTNHTSFFREPRHFGFLRETIWPTLRTRPQIHLWSAACSSGEEPYTIAMTLLEHAREEVLAKVRIRATDISTRMLDRGRSGIYPADRLKDVPYPVLQHNMLKGRTAAGESFRFKPEVRAMITFEHLNLMQPLPEGYRCSVIFCRNIMIYFDKPTQQALVARLTQQLEDGGYLFIGHSESLSAVEHTLDYVSPATYRKPLHAGSTKSSSKMGGA
jgi:chemotaxis protein methyltransferase CheR